MKISTILRRACEVAAISLLAGCTLSGYEATQAYKACENRDGIDEVIPGVAGAVVLCMDGSRQEIRR